MGLQLNTPSTRNKPIQVTLVNVKALPWFLTMIPCLPGLDTYWEVLVLTLFSSPPFVNPTLITFSKRWFRSDSAWCLQNFVYLWDALFRSNWVLNFSAQHRTPEVHLPELEICLGTTLSPLDMSLFSVYMILYKTTYLAMEVLEI